MNRKLQAQLRLLDRAGFRELELCVGIARHFRQLGPDHAITDEAVCERFGFNVKRLHDYKTGAYPYTVEELAMIQAAHASLEMDRIKTDMVKITEAPRD